MALRSVTELSIKNRRILLRFDGNVPILQGRIMDDFRLKAFLPTLDFLLSHQPSRVILATHLGRPQPLATMSVAQEQVLSVYPLVSWLSKHGYCVTYNPDMHYDGKVTKKDTQLVMLENLRFYHGEQNNDGAFAHALASLADYYVSDAFGVIHRGDASIVAVPALFDPSCRAAGLLLEREVCSLSRLREAPEKPFVVLMGGNKIKDKLDFLSAWCVRDQRPDTVLLGGALAFPFLQTDHEYRAQADQVRTRMHQVGVQLVLPEDLRDDGKDIGPLTVERFMYVLQEARTIFVNGTVGIYEEPEAAHGTVSLMRVVARSSAYTVVGGGDAVAAAFKAGVTDTLSFISTGGGATLVFLSSDDPYKKIPGLQLLNRNQQPGRMFDEGAG